MMVLQQGNEAAISHLGSVSKIIGNSVFVTLSQNVHCTSCNAKSACVISEAKTKEIEILNPTETYEVNEAVYVVLKKKTGINAVLWAYLIPFFLLLTVLISTSVFFTEWQSGLLALAILIPYYVMLHQLNGFFKKKLQVSIQKLM